MSTLAAKGGGDKSKAGSKRPTSSSSSGSGMCPGIDMEEATAIELKDAGKKHLEALDFHSAIACLKLAKTQLVNEKASLSHQVDRALASRMYTLQYKNGRATPTHAIDR